jgi:hypothetical protein
MVIIILKKTLKKTLSFSQKRFFYFCPPKNGSVKSVGTKGNAVGRQVRVVSISVTSCISIVLLVIGLF